MTLKIISAEDILFEGEVTMVKLPGQKGQFTVLRDHAAIVSTLVAGKVVYRENGEDKEVAVTGGIVDVANNVVSVCIY
ncbi:MAG: ATP synthase F1 subunit epsilon [Muribaculaceae bacterium]|nr:ATP synthase F1 subunit epsilon [Muribaculaceae bacterium]